MTVIPDSNFVAKTDLANKGCAVVNPVSIPALTPLLHTNDQEDHLLCLVQVIQYYLQCTKVAKEERKKLFLSYKAGHTGFCLVYP